MEQQELWQQGKICVWVFSLGYSPQEQKVKNIYNNSYKNE